MIFKFLILFPFYCQAHYVRLFPARVEAQPLSGLIGHVQRTADGVQRRNWSPIIGRTSERESDPFQSLVYFKVHDHHNHDIKMIDRILRKCFERAEMNEIPPERICLPLLFNMERFW